MSGYTAVYLSAVWSDWEISVAKGRRWCAGVRAGEQAADFREGEFAPEAGDDGGDEERHGGDDDAERHPVEAVAVFERGEEGGADAQADAGKEQRQAEFAHHEIGALRDVVGDGEAPAIAADEDGDDEWAASEAEFDRHRHAGYRDGDGAEDDAEGDADGRVRSGVGFAGRAWSCRRR